MVEDIENSYLNFDELAPEPIQDLLGHSITYRITIGAKRGRKVFALQTLPPQIEDENTNQVGSVAGFSLHAGVATSAKEREKLERICRYIARPAVSEKRLTLTSNGNVKYQLKTPYRNGTTHVIFEPLDFMAKLAALIPKPKVNLTRVHGVFAPNSQYRKIITSEGKAKKSSTVKTVKTNGNETEKRKTMTWGKRLKRIFNIDIEICEKCQGHVKIIACIEVPVVIDKILAHLKNKEEKVVNKIHPVRAPPEFTLVS